MAFKPQIPDVTKVVNAVTSKVLGTDTSTNTESSSQVNLKNFVRERRVDGTKWNKVFPYVLRLGSFSNQPSKTSNDNSLSNSASGILSKAKDYSSKVTNLLSSGKTNVKDAITEVVLPIAPQNISVITPSASNVTVTLRGIVEEHNGAPLRIIKISGTTGVTPRKGITTSDPAPKTATDLLSSVATDLFKNTIKSVAALKDTILGAGAPSILDATLFQSPNILNNDTLAAGINNTGYFHFHRLVDFVDQYQYQKKFKENKDTYLVFEMHKDELFYKCLLKSFSWQKQPGTLEYLYNIEMIAWAYENPTTRTQDSSSGIQGSDPSTIQKLVATVRKARRVLSGARNIVKGLGQDIDNVLLIGNEVILAGKDATGVISSIADLPQSAKNSFKTLIVNEWSNLGSQFQNALNSVKKNLFGTITVAMAQADQNQDKTKIPIQVQNQIDQLFSQPDKYIDALDAIDTSSLPVSQALQDQIDAENERIRQLATSDWIKRRNDILNFSNGLANAIGSGDATYNQAVGIAPPTKSREMRLSELELLRATNELLNSLNFIIVQKRNQDQSVQAYVDFFVDMALANGIDFTSPLSKFAVPVNLGVTLQGIALQYLGDSSRWIELAALNRLRSPYIDEDGFTKPIIGSTTGKIITLADAEKLYVNQPVMISDSTQPIVRARIKTIQMVEPGTVLITLDKDVTGYSISSSAQLKAYLPNTVNSQMFIYIPSQASPTVLAEDFKFSPGVDDQSILASIARADIALTSEGDIALTSAGDTRVVTGVANLFQAAKLKLVTPLGSLIQHPGYGLGILAGSPTGDFNTSQTFSNIEKAFAQDGRFSSVLASRVTKTGGTVTIDAVLGMPNTDTVLPLSVNLKQ